MSYHYIDGRVLSDPRPSDIVHSYVRLLSNSFSSQVRKQALDFLDQYHADTENTKPVHSKEKREMEVLYSLSNTGEYTHTANELEWAAKTAWRNASRCPGMFALDHGLPAFGLKVYNLEIARFFTKRLSNRNGNVLAEFLASPINGT